MAFPPENRGLGISGDKYLMPREKEVNYSWGLVGSWPREVVGQGESGSLGRRGGARGCVVGSDRKRGREGGVCWAWAWAWARAGPECVSA